MKSVDQIVAESLEIDVSRVSDDLKYNAIPEWDSLNHVTLMMAIETEYGVTVGEEQMVELSTVGRIRAFVGKAGESDK